MANKVRFGLENVHFCTYTVGTDGTVTLGTPYHLQGAVSMNLDPSVETSEFYADNVRYWTGANDNGYEGELEMALFTDEFKTQFLNYVTLTGGGIAQVKGQPNKDVCIIFEGKGDAEKTRGILYNVSLGQISRTHETTTETTEPQTATLSFVVSGDNKTGIVMAEYGEEDTAYATLFTAPPVPTLP